MKPGWIIIVAVTIICFVLVVFIVVQGNGPRSRIAIEAPTVVINPTQESLYPQPQIYPGAQQIQVKLTARHDCIDNCEAFESLKGLGVRTTGFFVTDSGEAVSLFYRNTLVEQGWKLNEQHSNDHYQVYEYKRSNTPLFSLSISIDRFASTTRVQIVEQLPEPFTWPIHN